MARSPDSNVERVREQLLDRSLHGLRKYGVTTERKDLSLPQWMQHLQEELMDAAVYVEAQRQRAQHLETLAAMLRGWDPHAGPFPEHKRTALSLLLIELEREYVPHADGHRT